MHFTDATFISFPVITMRQSIPNKQKSGFQTQFYMILFFKVLDSVLPFFSLKNTKKLSRIAKV